MGVKEVVVLICQWRWFGERVCGTHIVEPQVCGQGVADLLKLGETTLPLLQFHLFLLLLLLLMLLLCQLRLLRLHLLCLQALQALLLPTLLLHFDLRRGHCIDLLLLHAGPRWPLLLLQVLHLLLVLGIALVLHVQLLQCLHL